MTVTTRALRSRVQEQPARTGKVVDSDDDEAASTLQPISTPRRSFSRTCSSPTPSTCSSTASSRRGKTCSYRASHSFSTPSFSSPMSKSASRDESDESEDDRSSTRLGGCQHSGSLRRFDDSNKENVPPRRLLTQAALERETIIMQEDSVAQRTRARGAAPMSDRSLSHAGSTISSRAGSSSGSINSKGSTMTSLRGFRRTVSTPITRKRQRGILDLDDGEDRVDFRTPTTPSSRLRLDMSSASIRSPPTDDAESYFSSQATSIFDNMSVGDGQTEGMSRCTTPELQEADDTMTIKCKKQQQHKEVILPSFANIFVHAKSLLRYGAGTDNQVVGRERERSCLQRFLQKRFNLFAHLEHSASPQGEAVELDGAPESGSLYICGLPGTGKTALVRSILADLEQQGEKKPAIAFVDCMSIQHPREVFAKVLGALGQEIEQDDVEAERRLSVIVKDSRRRTLIVLDEIDHLLRNRVHQNILYRLFSWGATSAPVANDQSGSCALIGIANSLDLTERFVPLLASKGAAPAVLNFRPFEAAEITTVLQARLSQLYPRYDVTATEELIDMDHESSAPSMPLIQSDAMMLASKKIAAATGDLRKALDACRLAIDAVESEETFKAENGELSHFTTTSAPKVKPAHFLKVLGMVLGSPKLNKIRDLGFQSKLVLLALLIAQKRQVAKLDILGSTTSLGITTGTQKMSIRDLECTYTAMLKNDEAGALPSVESSELMDVIEGLEVEGVVRIVSDAATTKSSSSSCRGAMGLSPSGKRAAKKQLLASNRAIVLVMSSEDVLKGICTASPSQAAETSKMILEAMNRVWNRESDRVERCKGWESMAAESKKVIDEELGGGRGAVGF